MKHSLPPEQFADLCSLIQSLHDEQITPKELARLEQWVCRDEEAGRVYVQYMNLYARLHWGQAQGTMSNQGLPNGKAQASKTPVLGFLGDVFQAGANFLSRSFVLTLLLSIGLPAIVLTILLVDLSRQPMPTPPREVARVIGVHQAVWGDADGELATGVILTSGQKLLLKEGLAELAFLDGTRVILQGPTTFQVGSTTNGFLNRGTVTATVPAAARGFTINTPMAKVVDLGTDFGVSVDDDGTVEAHVFKGEIEVENRKTSENVSPSKMRLKKGQAAIIARPKVGQTPLILAMASAPNRFVRHLPELAASKPTPRSQTCFAHRGKADPLTEGWKILYRGKNANVKQDTPDLVPVKDGATAAWMMDNRIPQKIITYHSNRKAEKGGLTPEMYELGKAKGWSLRVRLKAENAIPQKSSSANTSSYFWYYDGEKIWAIFVCCLRDGTQRVNVLGKMRKGNEFSKKMPNSRDRYIEYEIRYHPATKDAEVFIDGKLVVSHFVGSVNGGYKKTGERGIDFGLRTNEGKAKFALVEWKVLDETPGSEQRRGN